MWDRRENIKRWQLKKKITFLKTARGNENSMFSLIMPYLQPISKVLTSLNIDYQKATTIENRVQQSSYLWAINSAKERLEQIKRVRFDGLALFIGTFVNEEGIEVQYHTDFEPFKPIDDFVYQFDTMFHTEALQKLFDSDDKFGIIVMDGRGITFGTLRGTTYEVLLNYRFPVELRWAHNMQEGSMSHIRMRNYRSYYMKAAGFANLYYFDPPTNMAKVTWLILAGQQRFMSSLRENIHPQLQRRTNDDVVEVQYGGHRGFEQAVEMSFDILGYGRFMQEKRLIRRFFHEVAASTEGKYFFGLEDTLKLIFKHGVIETLIVWEDLDINVRVMKNSISGRISIQHEGLMDGNNREWVVKENISLVEWLANEYTRYGFRLDIVSNHTQEGVQFCRGFEGIGGIILNKEPHVDDDASEDVETGHDDCDDSEDVETDHDDGEIPDDALLSFWDDL